MIKNLVGNKIKILAIVGPTATGKSALAVWIAKKINAEIISADSMQVYKYMDIATAKITKEEQCGVVHHIMSFLNVNEEFSVADYVEMANKTILQIVEKGKNIVLVGGTGLYIDSLLNGIYFQKEYKSDSLRNILQNMADEKGFSYMYEKLKEIDPIYSKKVHINNKKKILRCFETFILTGKNVTDNIKLNNSSKRPFSCLKIGLNFKDRLKLYENINIRVDRMFEKGLLQEARNIFLMNCSKTAMQAIGYKELFLYFSGEITLNEAIENIKRNTRRYAKRQITWFKRDEAIKWFFLDEKECCNIKIEILKLAENFIQSN